MERLMQYVWQHRLWQQSDMLTVDGRKVQVIDPGRLNSDSGPDFFNAKISIDGHLWAGDVEIHVRASDWHRHNHDGNPAYDSVILHVVDRDDAVIRRSNGEIIPQMRMPCSPDFRDIYNRLVARADIALPCSDIIRDIPSIYLTDWISTLAYERIQEKACRCQTLLERFSGDWESVCYVTVARSLGFGLNGEPFERLALSLPLRFIGKHADSLFCIEAMLFGQSGLLDDVTVVRGGDYAMRLKSEYDFMARKFGLRPLQSAGWKTARMRPANFPHRRIATLAAMLHGGFRMLSRILQADTVEKAAQLFSPELTGYWKHRYGFGEESPRTASSMSRSSVNVLIINTVIPLQFAYAIAHGDNELADRAVAMLQSIPPERNSLVELFRQAGLNAHDAFYTQAFIQLRRAYCEQHKCLYCRIGHRMLAARARRRDID